MLKPGWRFRDRETWGQWALGRLTALDRVLDGMVLLVVVAGWAWLWLVLIWLAT